MLILPAMLREIKQVKSDEVKCVNFHIVNICAMCKDNTLKHVR